MVSVCPTAMPSASVASRDAVPTSARSEGGVRFSSGPVPESRGMNTPGTGSRPVCTSAGFASQSEGNSPPTGVRSNDPSSLMVGDSKSDLVQVRHKDDGRLSLPQGQPEVAGAVGLGPGPRAGATARPPLAPALPSPTRHNSPPGARAHRRPPAALSVCLRAALPWWSTAPGSSGRPEAQESPPIQLTSESRKAAASPNETVSTARAGIARPGVTTG